MPPVVQLREPQHPLPVRPHFGRIPQMPDRDHQSTDEASLAMAGLVAEKVAADPQLIRVAQENLKRWIGKSKGSTASAHLEWQQILNTKSPNEILNLLRSPTEEGQRLRQSNPFAGILTPQERWQILSAHDSPTT